MVGNVVAGVVGLAQNSDGSLPQSALPSLCPSLLLRAKQKKAIVSLFSSKKRKEKEEIDVSVFTHLPRISLKKID